MRSANGLESLDGMKYLASVPDNEVIVSMVDVKGTLFVSTDKHIYFLEDNKRLTQVVQDEY